jgi:hypothetical protein
MSLPDIVLLLVLAAAALFVWDSLRVREIANGAMRSTCKAEGLLFLDDTVALQSMRPSRDDSGHLRLRRVYVFEFSDTGHNRRKGSVVMMGDAVFIMDIGALLTGETLH